MYGLVNKAVEDLVRSQFGDDVWERIRHRAGVEDDLFISMDGYPDAITYQLVGAASEELKITPAQVLEAFGEYWVLYTAREGYGEMLRMAGDTLQTFLMNLNNLHAHVGLVFPHLQPPSFQCSDLTDHSLNLHYYSHREGLAPMVIGLVKGLGKMFNTEVAITHTLRRELGADHDAFLIEH